MAEKEKNDTPTPKVLRIGPLVTLGSVVKFHARLLRMAGKGELSLVDLNKWTYSVKEHRAMVESVVLEERVSRMEEAFK